MNTFYKTKPHADEIIMDSHGDAQIKALLPKLINGKTHEQLEEEEKLAESKGLFHYVDGIKLPWVMQLSNIEALKTFEVRDDDVYIFTFPRSGTHWVAEIVQCLLHDGRSDFDRTFMKSHLELVLIADQDDLKNATPGWKLCAAMKSPRCILSHCPEKFRPPQLKEKKPKIIYPLRNPKDLIVSFFKLLENLPFDNLSGNFDEFLWRFYLGKMSFGAWFDRVLEAWSHKDEENVLFVKYEDLHKNLRGSICRIAKFIGKDVSDDVIDSIMENVTFLGMKKAYKKLEDEQGEKAMKMTHFGGNPHLRQGKVGEWKNYFTVEQNDLFDKVYALRMQGTGLEFDFEL